MNRIIYVGIALTGLMSCGGGQEFTVSNPSGFERRNEIVELPVASLRPLKSGKAYYVKNGRGERLPSQLTYDGKLIFQASLGKGETQTYSVGTGAPVEYPSLVYGRLVPERKDDYAWENDRVAFRVYGEKLMSSDGPSNGLDLWYKRTSEKVIDKWYEADLSGKSSYHTDSGEGMDAYDVKRSLGGGAMAPFINDSLILGENFVRSETLENGPLRTTFRLYYKELRIDSVVTVSETRTISLDAGSQLTRITEEYGAKQAMTVAAGIVRRKDSPEDAAQAGTTDSGAGIIMYEEPETPTAGKVYVGLVFPAGIEADKTDDYTIFHPTRKAFETYSHVLGITTYTPGRPVTYYAGYGWEKWGFPTAASFQNYLVYFATKLEEPLVVKFF
jgi:hypothetical protein